MSDTAEIRFFELGMAKGKEIEQERIIKFLMPYLEKAVTLGLTVTEYEAIKKGLENDN